MEQRNDNNRGQVTQTGDIHVHAAKAVRKPPENHPNSRECPQCHGKTWRLTQWCIHCGADLFAIDSRERERRVGLRNIKISVFFMALSALAFYCQTLAPPVFKLWVVGLGVFSMTVAAAILKS